MILCVAVRQKWKQVQWNIRQRQEGAKMEEKFQPD